MVKIEIDVNVRGLDFLKELISSKLNESNDDPKKGVPASAGPVWTTNEVPRENISQPTTPMQPQAAVPTASTKSINIKPQTGNTIPQDVSGVAPTATIAYSFEQIQKCAAGLARSGKREELMSAIKSFGVSALTDILQEQYNDLAAKLRELGGVI